MTNQDDMGKLASADWVETLRVVGYRPNIDHLGKAANY